MMSGMKMTAMTEAPELPEWVKAMIRDAHERGYEEGYAAGRRQMGNDVKNFIEGRHW